MKQFNFGILLTLLFVSLGFNILLLLVPPSEIEIGSSGGPDEARAPQSILSPRKRSQVPRAEKKEKILQAIGPTVALPRAVSMALSLQAAVGEHGILKSLDSNSYARWKSESQLMLGATDAEFAAVERAIDQLLDDLAVELRAKASKSDDSDARIIHFNIAPLETDYRKAFEDSLSSHMDAQMAEDFRNLVFRSWMLGSLEFVRTISLDLNPPIFTYPHVGADSNRLLLRFGYADGSHKSWSSKAELNRLFEVFANLAVAPVQE